MDTKTCPACGEEILATAKKCKHCGEWLEERRPAAATPDMPAKEEDKPTANETSQTADATEERGFFDYYLNEVWALKSNGSSDLLPRFDFEGVLPRKRFWISLLLVWCTFGVIVNTLFTPAIIMRIFSNLSFLHKIWGVVALFIMPCFYVKLFEMIARRVRDTGRSGWLALVPIANLIFCCEEGSPTAKTSWGKKDWASVIFIIIAIGAVYYGSKIEREYFGKDSDNKTYAVPGTNYYQYTKTWVKSEDGRCYYTVMSTDKSDSERAGYLNYDIKGILTIVSAQTPGGKVTPIVGTADISFNDDDVDKWTEIAINSPELFPSSEYSDVLYFNYFLNAGDDTIQKYVVLDCKTGEFDILDGHVFGIIRNGSYAGCYLASDDKFKSDMDTLYIIDQFRPDELEDGIYREELDYESVMTRFNHNYDEIIGFIEQY